MKETVETEETNHHSIFIRTRNSLIITCSSSRPLPL